MEEATNLQPAEMPIEGMFSVSGSALEVEQWMLRGGGEPAVAFDLGGVLLEGGVLSLTGEAQAFTRLEEEFGIPFEAGLKIWRDLQDQSERGVMPASKVFQALSTAGTVPDPAGVEQALLDMVRPIPSAVSVLQDLHERGWRTALATNHLRTWVHEWQARFSWFECLDVIVVSAEIGERKPSPKFFARLEERISATGSWFIDDRPENLEAAEKSGFRAVWVSGDGQWHVRAR